MPAAYEEFTGDELAHTLAESRGHADTMLTLALALETRLPGTKAALRDGIITRHKAETITYATALLDPAESRAAETLILGRAGRLTPGGLRGRDRPRRHGSRPGQGAQAAGGGGEGRQGAAVGGRFRERGADGP
jgi:Domain of unknown function (DUF222)